MPLSDREIAALISLLDDTDVEVVQHVEEKLVSLGPDGIRILENASEHIQDAEIQIRLEEIIERIHFSNVKDLMQKWLNEGAEDILEGALLVCKFQYPDVDMLKFVQRIQKIAQSVWIELNQSLTPLEEINVLNHVFFNLHGFVGEGEHPFDPVLGYISDVINNKRGNSISLGLLYLLIAQENKLTIYGINLPYHFILAYTKSDLTYEELEQGASSDKVIFYINPLNNGMVFSRAEITNYLERSKIPIKESFYSPCHPKEIIKALILHQMNAYEQSGQIEKGRKMKELYSLFLF